MTFLKQQIATLEKVVTRRGKRDKDGIITEPPMLVLSIAVPVEHLDGGQIAWIVEQADRDIYLSLLPLQSEMPLKVVKKARYDVTKEGADFFLSADEEEAVAAR